MAACTVCLTFTEREFEYLNKRALLKKATLWTMLQGDINKVFEPHVLSMPAEYSAPEENKKKFVRNFTIPQRTWRSIVYLSKVTGMSPTQLVYRLIVAPHLPEIIKEGTNK